MPRVDFNLYLITDRLNLPPGRTLSDQVEEALVGGVRAVQLREKDLGPRQLLPLASQLRELTLRYGARLIINSCVETALAVKADGVHLPGEHPSIGQARQALGPAPLIGVSTHGIEEITLAAAGGADFVTFGPVFRTPSKDKYRPPVGTEALKEAIRVAPVPVFALGGVSTGNVPELLAAGCTRFACIAAILKSDNPSSAARSFLAAVNGP